MIKYQRVFWSGQYLFPDTDDPGDEPDVGLLEGAVTFAPVWDAGVSGLLSDSQRSTYVKPFPIEIRDGQLMSSDDGTWIPGVKIPASIGGHPLAWVARFDLSAGGEKVTARELRFTSNPDGEVHLHNVIPAEAIFPQLPPDIVKGDSVTNIYTQGQYVVFIVGDPPRTKQYVLAFPGTADAVAAAEAAVAEFEQLRDAGVLAIEQTRTSAEAAITQTRDDAVTTVTQAKTSAETAIGQTRTDAESSINQVRTDAEASIAQTRTDAEASMAQALTQAHDARDAAEISRSEAHDSEVAADESARDAAADRVIVSDLKVQVDNSRSHVDQKVQDFDADYLAAKGDIDATYQAAKSDINATHQSAKGDIEGMASDWEAQFDQDLLTFQGLKTEMQNIATDVAADVAHLDGIVVQVEDALDVVRAHRWVPRGEWDAATTYVAGDVVVFDGGSYYAGADIPVGTAPPGGQWAVLGQGGISDASELSGKLGPLVDASGASVDLSAEVGVPPEMHDALLHEILGVLARGLDATVDADRVEGSVTAHLDLSSGMVTFIPKEWDGSAGDPLTMPISEFAEMIYQIFGSLNYSLTYMDQMLTAKANLVDGKVPLEELPELGSTDAADLTGALTNQVDVSAAMVQVADPNTGVPSGDPMPTGLLIGLALMLVQQAVDGLADKSDMGHQHPVSDLSITGTASSSTFINGDGEWATPPNTTYSTMSQAEAEDSASTTARLATGQRLRQAANAAITARTWDGTQAQYDALATKDPNVTYYVVED